MWKSEVWSGFGLGASAASPHFMACRASMTGCSLVSLHMVYLMLKVDEMLENVD